MSHLLKLWKLKISLRLGVLDLWKIVFSIFLFFPYLTIGSENKNGVSPNAISLPSGPGSIEGLGEAFQPTLNTGTGKHSVPIKAPPGPAGRAPTIALIYEGGDGNSSLGMGWQLPLPYVQRQTDKGVPRYIDSDNGRDDDHDQVIDEPDERDRFIDQSREELVPVINGPVTDYFCENEGAFIRYRKLGSGWEGRSPDGTRMLFGLSDESRISDPSDPDKVFRWLLERQIDRNGNETHYHYRSFADETNVASRYLSAITYGAGPAPWNAFHIISFRYEPRQDWFEDCRAGFPIRVGKRLSSIRVATQGVVLEGHLRGDANADGVEDYLNRRYQIHYHSNASVSLIAAVTEFGADDKLSLPPSRYAYTTCTEAKSISAGNAIIRSANEPLGTFADPRVDFLDLNGDALPDLLRTVGGVHLAYLNQGERETPNGSRAIHWSQALDVSEPINGISPWPLSLERDSITLADVDGDGLSDLLQMERNATYVFTNSPKEGVAQWQSRKALPAMDAIPPSPYGTGGTTRSFDINFDKRADIVRSAASGGTYAYHVWFNLDGHAFSDRATVSPETGYNFADPSVKTGDLNGDRLTDIIRIRPSSLQCTVSLGNGNFLPEEIIPIPDTTLSVGQLDKAALQDVNGDGLVDLVIERPVPGEIWIWPNQGNRSFGDKVSITELPPVFSTATASRWADLNGNGTLDFVLADPAASRGERLLAIDLGRLMGCVPRPYLLNRVENGIGRVEHLTYTTSTEFTLEDGTNAEGDYHYPWPHPLPFPVTVIKEVRTSDSLGDEYATQFAYHDGYYDPEEKQFRGFARVEQIDVGDESAPTLITQSRFDTGFANEALKGKILTLSTTDSSGEIFNRETTTWEVATLYAGSDDRFVCHAQARSVETKILEQGRGHPKVTRINHDYDTYGNVLKESDWGIIHDEGTFVDERITTTSFAINQDLWLLRYPYQAELSDGEGNVIKRSQSFYDDETFGAANGGIVTKGNVTVVREWTDIAADRFIASKRLRYDAFGNAIKLYDPLWQEGKANGHWRELDYDTIFHAFPLVETVHIDGAVPSLSFRATYDYGFGMLTSATSPNAHTTHYRYDALGRPLAIVKPLDTIEAPTLEFEYVLAKPFGESGLINFVETQARENTGGGQFITREFFDGLGRARLTKHEDESPEHFVTKVATVFNARREPRRLYNPYQSRHFDYEEPREGHYIETQYDALLRPVRVINQDGTMSGKTYEPLMVISSDENDLDPASKHHDTPMVHHHDGLGRFVRVDEIVKLDNQGREGPRTSWSTHYGYRADDKLLTVLDSQNNLKVFRYDALGRKTFMDDPNRGVMRYLHDAASNVIQTTDHKGQIIRFTFDGANRLWTEDYLDEGQPYSANHAYDPEQPISVQNRPDVAYFYDLVSTNHGATNLLGQLASVWDISGEEHFSYDARSRLAWQIKAIPDPVLPNLFVPYQTRYQHDSLDRVVQITYPDGDTIAHEFNGRGELEAITGGPSGHIISQIAYKPWGSLETCAYGNGVLTSYDYDTRLRLKTLNTVSPEGKPFIDYGYVFDSANNITQIADKRALQPEETPRQNSQVFDYDSLYRLTSVQYPSLNQKGIRYRYDRVGNMLEKTSTIHHLRNGHSVTNLGTMRYGGEKGSANRGGRGASTAGPHALTHVAEGDRSYTYDRNGNMTDIDGLACTWDSKDRLVMVENDEMRAVYVYDYTDRRILKRVTKKAGDETTDVTQYINRYFEIRPGEPPVKYIWNGDTRVARVTGTLNQDNPTLIQPVHLFEGWNLVSFGCAVDSDQLEPFNYTTQSYYWDAEANKWKAFVHKILPAHDPLWIKASESTILVVTGPRAPPLSARPLTQSHNGYYVNSTGRPLAPPLLAEARDMWWWHPQSNQWQTYVQTGPLSSAFHELPAQLPPQTVFYANGLGPADTDNTGIDFALDIRYYHQDHLGSSNVVTDAEGVLIEEVGNYPYGEPRVEFQPRGESESYRFTQKERDVESRLHYFEARFLASSLGRFTRPDPILVELPKRILSVPQALSAYAYGHNRPLFYVDPTGNEVETWSNQFFDKVVSSGGNVTLAAIGATFLDLTPWGAANKVGTNAANGRTSSFGESIDALSFGGAGKAALALSKVGVISKGLRTASSAIGKKVKSFFGKLRTPKRTLYHYTDDAGLDGITRSRKLNPSLKANNPNDVRYGNGQYLSDIVPGTKTNAQLSRKFLNMPFQGKQFKNYVEVDVTDLPVKKGRDGVFVIPNETPLDLTGKIISSGSN